MHFTLRFFPFGGSGPRTAGAALLFTVKDYGCTSDVQNKRFIGGLKVRTRQKVQKFVLESLLSLEAYFPCGCWTKIISGAYNILF